MIKPKRIWGPNILRLTPLHHLVKHGRTGNCYKHTDASDHLITDEKQTYQALIMRHSVCKVSASVKADLRVILMYPNLFISTIAAVIAVIISADNSSQIQFHIHCYRPPFDHPALGTICRLAVVKPVAAVAFLPPDPWEKRLAIQGEPTEWQSPHQINITYLSPSLSLALHYTPGTVIHLEEPVSVWWLD